MQIKAEHSISPQARVEQIFKEIDTDNDKKISRQEFVKALLRDEFLRNLLAPI